MCSITYFLFSLVAYFIDIRVLRIKRGECQISRMSWHLLQRSACQNVRFVGFLGHHRPHIPHQSSRRISVREFTRTGPGCVRSLAVWHFRFDEFLTIAGKFLFSGNIYTCWRLCRLVIGVFSIIWQTGRCLLKCKGKNTLTKISMLRFSYRITLYLKTSWFILTKKAAFRGRSLKSRWPNRKCGSCLFNWLRSF